MKIARFCYEYKHHLNGSSIHEENGHYFKVDQKFRNKINSLYEQE